jgi:hypothetical protein
MASGVQIDGPEQPEVQVVGKVTELLGNTTAREGARRYY